MTEPPKRGVMHAGDIDSALAMFAEERRKAQEMQDAISQTTTVVHSKDRVLSMTLDGRGELERLTFDGTRYRRMAPAELANVITETLAAGRRQAMDKIGGLMGAEVLPGVAFQDLATGNVAVNDVIESFLGAALDALPDRVKGLARARLEGER